jgi:hypothetical protein
MLARSGNAPELCYLVADPLHLVTFSTCCGIFVMNVLALHRAIYCFVP